MEFWCLIKEYYNYDVYNRDLVVNHYQTEFEGLDEFYKYIKMYMEDYHIEDNEYELKTEDDHYNFIYSDGITDINICLYKIFL